MCIWREGRVHLEHPSPSSPRGWRKVRQSARSAPHVGSSHEVHFYQFWFNNRAPSTQLTTPEAMFEGRSLQQ